MLDGRPPYFIRAADGGVLSFAGLWDRLKNSETGEPMISCTIIVTDANKAEPIHDHMPVVLDRADIRPVAERRSRRRAAKAGR
jgi:putative SOS response-associated peptidase YedK